MATKRKYPVGVQSFEKLRKEGYLYVDKTPLIYKMITEGCPYFLSRPRRFGKSLLTSTLHSYFAGERESTMDTIFQRSMSPLSMDLSLSTTRPEESLTCR